MQQAHAVQRAWTRGLVLAVLVLLVLRAVSMVEPALVDTTEGRYGAIALRMLQTGDWVTPQIPRAHGYEPYLGKPPLHFWSMAGALWCCGPSAWAARLPSLLAAAVMLWATMGHARRQYGNTTALLAGVMLLSSALFALFAGAVNVDMTLAASVTVAITAFCRVGEGGADRRSAGYLFFVSLALGVLTKGPFAVAFTGLVGLLHLLVHRNRRIVTGLPWVGGSLVFAALVVPWYWLAESRNPGFLHYFLAQENLGRFTSAEYGDRYGSGRHHPYGTIWPMLVGCALPWSLPLVLAPGVARWRARAWAARRSHGAFLLLWALAPAAVFTCVPQWTAGYLLPGFGGLAILAARVLRALGRARSPLGAPLLGWTARTIALAVPVLGGVAWWCLGAGSMRGGIGIALGVAGAVGIWLRTRHCTSTPAAAVWLGLAMGWLLAVGELVVAPYASGSKSMAPILERFLAAEPSRAATIGIPFGNPYSAWFYGAAWTGDRVRFAHVDTGVMAAGAIDDVFLKVTDAAHLPAAVRERYVVRGAAGDWEWLQRR